MDSRACGGNSWRRRNNRQVESGPAELAIAMRGPDRHGRQRPSAAANSMGVIGYIPTGKDAPHDLG